MYREICKLRYVLMKCRPPYHPALKWHAECMLDRIATLFTFYYDTSVMNDPAGRIEDRNRTLEDGTESDKRYTPNFDYSVMCEQRYYYYVSKLAYMPALKKQVMELDEEGSTLNYKKYLLKECYRLSRIMNTSLSHGSGFSIQHHGDHAQNVSQEDIRSGIHGSVRHRIEDGHQEGIHLRVHGVKDNRQVLRRQVRVLEHLRRQTRRPVEGIVDHHQG